MRTCARCGRAFPEVRGAPEQACPHCGLVVATPLPTAIASPLGVVDPWAAASAAFRTWSRSLPALMALWTPVVAASVAASALLAWYSLSTGLPVDPFEMSDAQRLRYLGVALPVSAAAFVVELAAWGLVAARAGGEPGAVRAALRRAPALLALALVLTFAYLAGFILLIVPFLVFLHWFLYAPAVAADGATVGRAIEESRAFAKQRRTYGFTALVILVYVGVAVAALGLGALAAGLLALAGVPAAYAEPIGAALGAWPVQPLVPLLPASYWHLAKRAPVAAASAPVAPDAPKAERFRTTKCPKCATLVPYSATGEPQDVTCPVCGTTGRVL